MKKLIILISSSLAATVLFGAGLRMGMTGAVKEKMRELDKKVMAAASSGSSASDADPSIPGSGTVMFSCAPLATTDYQRITPLGHMIAPGHTVPTDHIYFVLTNASATSSVRCPAAGYVTVINKSSDTDYAITVAFTSTFQVQFGHMTGIDASLGVGALALGENKVRVQVSAGQLLGTVGGTGMNGACLDFGAYDTDVTLALINTSRYSVYYKHAVCPLDFYEDPLKTTMYSKVTRTGTPLGGKIVYDQAGRLTGNWFWEHQSTTIEADRWAQQVSFAYDCIFSTRPAICIGGHVMTSGLYAFPDGTTLPENITPSTGKVIYRLYMAPEGTEPNTAQYGTLIVQMVSDDKIRIEGTTNLTATDFTSASYYYVR